ncbi:unnamed protein product [Symbiodinium sp. CCMP2592]|nr:unnamed protein product [Symbiodinium sp. CCMP2592]
MSLPMTAGTLSRWSPGAPIIQTTAMPAAGGELSSLLTEVAKNRAEAAELRLRLMHQGAAPAVQAQPVKVQDTLQQQQRLISWQPPVQAASAHEAVVADAAKDVRARLARLRNEIAQEDVKVPQQRAAGTADKRPRPKVGTKSPIQRRARPSAEAPESEPRPARMRQRQSRPTSPASSMRSYASAHSAAALRTCTSVPEYRLKPPEPQFLFSLPLSVYTGPKQLVDLTFKSGRGDSRSPSPQSRRANGDARSPPRRSTGGAPSSAAGYGGYGTPSSAAQSLRPAQRMSTQTERLGMSPPGSPRSTSPFGTPGSAAFAWPPPANLQQAIPARCSSPYRVVSAPRAVSPIQASQQRALSPPQVLTAMRPASPQVASLPGAASAPVAA